MTNRRQFLTFAGMTVLGGCAAQTDMSRLYAGPKVKSVQVQKGARVLLLLNDGEILRAYKIDLGFAPAGSKEFEGDGRTPEGRYTIDRRNPESDFFLSLGISYPNRADIAAARAAGRDPGGDIFIHGQMPRFARRALSRDWTAGCIAVDNSEMREIYWMVPVGTPITIYA